MDRIWVGTEWDELHECVYGAPDRFVLPRFYDDSKLRAQGAFGAFWAEHHGEDLAEAHPEWFAAFQAQVQGAIDFLRAEGVVVHTAGALSDANRAFPRGEDHGVLTGWMRDPFVTIGSNVIELAPRSLFHRRQRFAIRDILMETMQRGARYFAQPDCGGDDHVEGWGYLEGGDIFVLGDRVLVGHSGGCSSPEGAAWLAHALGDDYSVDLVPVEARFPHLDCVLSCVREGLAVACLEALPEGLPDHMHNWDIIDIPATLAKGHMGVNNLVLGPGRVLVPSEAALDPVAEALRARGCEVPRIPYEVPCMVGGSFRCAHQPLRRGPP